MPPFYIEYYCYREQPVMWRRFGRGLFSPLGRSYRDFGAATAAADALIWRYHSARVVDVLGNPLYQV